MIDNTQIALTFEMNLTHIYHYIAPHTCQYVIKNFSSIKEMLNRILPLIKIKRTKRYTCSLIPKRYQYILNRIIVLSLCSLSIHTITRF